MKVSHIAVITAIIAVAIAIAAFTVLDSEHREYSISYELNGGTNGDNPSSYSNDTDVTLDDPSRTGYTFDGWFLDSDFEQRISTLHDNGDVVLYAKWTVNKYSIAYILNGGTNSPSNPDILTYGSSMTLDDPVRTGYVFSGWFLDTEFNNEITAILQCKHSLTLYAKWIPQPYRITYILNGGENDVDNPKAFSINEPVTLNDPSKEGYTFEMWIDEDNNVVTTIDEPSDITVTAIWSKELTGTILDYTVTGTFTEDGGQDTTSFVSLREQVYLEYDADKGYRVYHHGFTNIGGVLTEESGTVHSKDIEITGTVSFLGNETVSNAGKDIICNVILISADDEYVKRFIGCDDGIIYRTESCYRNEGKVFNVTTENCGIGHVDPNDGFDVVIYDGTGIHSTGTGTYSQYSEVTLTAGTDDGHTFKGWYSQYGELLSTSPIYRIEVLPNDLTVFALNTDVRDLCFESNEVTMDAPAGLHDVTWTYKDGDESIVSEGNTLVHTFSDSGDITLLYHGKDADGNDRYGIILISVGE